MTCPPPTWEGDPSPAPHHQLWGCGCKEQGLHWGVGAGKPSPPTSSPGNLPFCSPSSTWHRLLPAAQRPGRDQLKSLCISILNPSERG